MILDYVSWEFLVFFLFGVLLGKLIGVNFVLGEVVVNYLMPPLLYLIPESPD